MILKLTDQQIELMAYRMFELTKLEKNENTTEAELKKINKEKILIGNLMKNKEVNLMADDATALKVGDIVEHNRFGQGEIVEINNLGGTIKADIKFKESGLKRLLLSVGFSIKKIK